MSMKLSICIPTYNREPYLRQLLESLCNQQRPDTEIVICDNASTDSTWDMVESLRRRFSNLRYVRSEVNCGPDANFLTCVQESLGEYCWFVGSDDDVIEGAVNSVIDLLIQFSPDGAIISKQNYDKELQVARNTYNPMGSAPTSLIETGSDNYYRILASLGYIGSICVRREKWLAIEPEFIGSAYVHVYICQRMIKAGAKFAYLANPVIKWRYENDSILAQAKLLGRLQIEFNYLEITKSCFGENSDEYRWVARDITAANIFWQLVTAKISGGYSVAMRHLAKKYVGHMPIYYSRILPLCYTPPVFLRGLQIARRFLRYQRVARV